MKCCPNCNEPFLLYHHAANALPEGEADAISLADMALRVYGPGVRRDRRSLNKLLDNAAPYLRIHGYVIKRKRPEIGRGGRTFVWKQRAKKLGSHVGNRDNGESTNDRTANFR